jgi:hypothetical protein
MNERIDKDIGCSTTFATNMQYLVLCIHKYELQLFYLINYDKSSLVCNAIFVGKIICCFCLVCSLPLFKSDMQELTYHHICFIL